MARRRGSAAPAPPLSILAPATETLAALAKKADLDSALATKAELDSALATKAVLDAALATKVVLAAAATGARPAPRARQEAAQMWRRTKMATRPVRCGWISVCVQIVRLLVCHWLALINSVTPKLCL